jgi:hypothetical protein
MTTLLSLLPLLLVLGLLASGRASALVAGLAGLAATLAASATLVLQADWAGRRGAAVPPRGAGGPVALLARHRHHRDRRLLPSRHPGPRRRAGRGVARGLAAPPVRRLLPAGALRRICDGLRRGLHHRAGGAAAAGGLAACPPCCSASTASRWCRGARWPSAPPWVRRWPA